MVSWTLCWTGWTRKPAWATGSWNPGWKACESPGCCWTGINEALTVLKKKPGNGPRLYELIYLTYIVPEKLSHTDLLFRLDLSSRQYYRLREEAISILSIRLWSVPEEELGRLVGLVDLLHM